MAEDPHSPPWNQPSDPISHATWRRWVDTARPLVERAIAEALAAGVPALTLHYVLCDETAKIRADLFGPPGPAAAEAFGEKFCRRPARRQEVLF